MAEGRQIPHHGEAIVLRTWPFHEADLLVSLFTREQGRVKGVARHAMKSRKRFGGALEPATYVRAHYTERPRQDLVRLDTFEILWSPLTAPVDYMRTAGLQLVVEVLEEALPELAPEDNVFRLALAVLQAMQGAGIRNQETGIRDKGTDEEAMGQSEVGDGSPLGVNVHISEGRAVPTMGHPVGSGVWLPVTYFCLWMNRLMGWWPELGHCAVCGLDLRGQELWWSPVGDGVTCHDDRRPTSRVVGPDSVLASYMMTRRSLQQMQEESEWPRERAADLRAFAMGVLERHLERRLRSTAAFGWESPGAGSG